MEGPGLGAHRLGCGLAGARAARKGGPGKAAG